LSPTFLRPLPKTQRRALSPQRQPPPPPAPPRTSRAGPCPRPPAKHHQKTHRDGQKWHRATVTRSALPPCLTWQARISRVPGLRSAADSLPERLAASSPAPAASQGPAGPYRSCRQHFNRLDEGPCADAPAVPAQLVKWSQRASARGVRATRALGLLRARQRGGARGARPQRSAELRLPNARTSRNPGLNAAGTAVALCRAGRHRSCTVSVPNRPWFLQLAPVFARGLFARHHCPTCANGFQAQSILPCASQAICCRRLASALLPKAGFSKFSARSFA